MCWVMVLGVLAGCFGFDFGVTWLRRLAGGAETCGLGRLCDIAFEAESSEPLVMGVSYPITAFHSVRMA